LGKRHGINCGVIGNTLGTLQEQTGNKKTHKNLKPHPVTLVPSPKRKKKKKKALMNACEVSLAA
jgi:hypothetical protein